MKHTPLIKATIAVTGLVTALTLGVLPANALTINFDLNGVAPVVHSESDPDSNKVTVPNLDLDFDNMTFTGWNTKANGRGETVEPGQTTKEDVLTNNDTITLYAQWADGTHLDIPGEYASLDDLTNVIASIAGTAIEGFNPLNNGGVWTIPHGSVVTLDVTKLLPENWSATYTQPDANTIVFTLTGLDKYGKELVVTYTFIVEPEVSGVASSTNPNAPSAGIGGELSNMSGSNNNSSTNQTTFTNTTTTNSNPLANIHLAAPIAFILAGILASLAVLQLTKREVARANRANTTSHKAPSKSLPNLLTSYAKTIIHNKAYLSIAIISAIAILGGSLYLTKGGVIEAASEGSSNTNTGRLDILDEINADGPKYQTMHSNNSITDTTYHNLTGNEYSGLVTVEDSLDKDLNGQTAWWYEGERQSGELSINKSWHYFDEDGYMVRDQAVTHNAKTSLAITDPDNTVDHDKDYTFRYDKDGKRIYGHQNIGGANFHFDEDTGIMTKGWGTLANGKTTYYALSNGAGMGGNMEHQLPISNGSTQTAWYYFDGEGVPVTNTVVTVNGNIHGYDSNGRRVAGGWFTLGNSSYNFDANGNAHPFYERGQGGGEVGTAYGLAQLAVRVATGADGYSNKIYVNNQWDKVSNPEAQEYIRIMEEVTARLDGDGSGNNSALASCTQAVGHIVRATVDPDIRMMGPEDMRTYLEGSARWERVGVVNRGSSLDNSGLKPGDVLCDVNDQHTAMYLGNGLVRQAYPNSSANTYQAHYTAKTYPFLETENNANYTYEVFRYKGKSGPLWNNNHRYIDVWKFLNGQPESAWNLGQ